MVKKIKKKKLKKLKNDFQKNHEKIDLKILKKFFLKK